MTKIAVQYPSMREEACFYLHGLKNMPAQQNLLTAEKEGEVICTFDGIVHFFFDDTNMSTDPDSYIGINLRNEAEAQAIRIVTREIDNLLARHGGALTDAEYVRMPEWPLIVAAAQTAIRLICPSAESA